MYVVFHQEERNVWYAIEIRAQFFFFFFFFFCKYRTHLQKRKRLAYFLLNKNLTPCPILNVHILILSTEWDLNDLD